MFVETEEGAETDAPSWDARRGSRKYVVDTNLYVEAITTDEGNAALASFQRRFAPRDFALIREVEPRLRYERPWPHR